MKKLTLVLLILIAIAGLIGPGISGHFLKTYHDDMTAQFNRQYPMYELSYTLLEDGWFSSRYQYQAKFKIPAAASADAATQAELEKFTQFSSELTYFHGPLPFAALANDAPFYPAAGTYSYEFAYAQGLADLTAEENPENAVAIAALPPITGTGWIQYNSDVHGTANINAGSITLKDGADNVTIDFGALTASTTANLNTQESKIVASLPALKLLPGDRGEEIALTNITMDLNGMVTTNQVPLINGDMRVGETKYRLVDYSGETTGQINGFRYDFSGAQNGEYVDSSIAIGIDSFSNDEIKVDAAAWTFRYGHLHEPSLGALYQKYQSMISSIYADPENFERNFEQQIQQLEPDAIKLLQYKPTLGSTIEYTSGNGKAKIDANVNIDQVTDEQLASITQIAQAAALLPNLYGKVTADIPEPVAKDIVGIAVDQEINAMKQRGRDVPPEQREQMLQQMLGMPVMMGYLQLVENDNGSKAYVGEAIFENMKLLLNGTEIPLEALLQ